MKVGSLGQVRVWTRIYFDLNVKPQTQFWEGISKMYVESMYVVCRNHFKHIWSPKRVPKWVLCLLQIEFQPVNSTLTQINSLFLILFKHLFLISLIKSVHFKKPVTRISFLTKLWYICTFNPNQNKKSHNFERNEIRATVFLKNERTLDRKKRVSYWKQTCFWWF